MITCCRVAVTIYIGHSIIILCNERDFTCVFTQMITASEEQGKMVADFPCWYSAFKNDDLSDKNADSWKIEMNLCS